jgi:hypothetical protein
MPRPSRQTRADDARTRRWVRPSNLAIPADTDSEYHYRWLRFEARGQADNNNMAMRLREGYEPVMASAHPGFASSTVDNGRFQGAITNGGLILARIPKEIAEDRQSQLEQDAEHQIKSVNEELMGHSDPHVPIVHDHRSNTTRGAGLPSNAQFDD